MLGRSIHLKTIFALLSGDREIQKTKIRTIDNDDDDDK